MSPIFQFRTTKHKSDSQSPISALIVGLGNPGREYRESRHNIGFMVVDRLAEQFLIKLTRVQNKAIIGNGIFNSVRFLLAKPQTYMNLSGESVSGLTRFYKIPHENILIVHDDIDLPFGTLRLRPSGGSAGQKGVQSIIERLGTQEFSRLRVGVGRPPGQKLGAAYVLQNFSKSEREELAVILDQASEAIKVFLQHGIDQAMNQFNGSIFED